MPKKTLKPNSLINEKSSYLLSHAYNPVHWNSWNKNILKKAEKQKKPILLSIGYSSCHWCHVMEKESFMDDEIADIMNSFFINIKIDREERPDIDKIYMESIQLMGINGGWPLNVFLTSQQKPFYGGTYFNKNNWKKLLISVVNGLNENKIEIEKSALKFTDSLQKSEIEKFKLNRKSNKKEKIFFEKIIYKNDKRFDKINGGINGAPKFPMPNVWEFLINYTHFFKNKKIEKQIKLTLNKILQGGIYDQIEGGFSRYSTDEKWETPHFEKMLYDNAQLLNLYANAYKIFKKKEYKKILIQTSKWLEKNMEDINGGFYSSIDADSEGIEGKFYVWSYKEFIKAAKNYTRILVDYYQIKKNGNWEHPGNILKRKTDDSAFLRKWKIEKKDFDKILKKFNSKLYKKRNKRVKPLIDKKIISSWNGLTLIGLLNTYEAIKQENILSMAIKNAYFISNTMINNNKLMHSYKSKTEGFLDDYSIVIQSFIKYFETMQNIKYLKLAKKLIDISINKFYCKKEKFFNYSSINSERLIANKKEIFDNVIPSSNSIMAENLLKISKIYDEKKYYKIAESMLKRIPNICEDGFEYTSNWLRILLNYNIGFFEIILTGKNLKDSTKKINSMYLSNKVILASSKKINMKLFNEKSFDKKLKIYLCKNKVCQLPVNNVSSLIKLIK